MVGVFIISIPKNPDGYLLEYKEKCKLLRSVPSPRIILVGGSNLAFGINSKRMADSLGITVINNGLHAGLGLKFILDDVVKYVRKGDIVVIAPEYSHFYGDNAYGEALIFSEILDIDLSYLNDLNLHQWKIITKGIHLLAFKRLDYLKSKYRKNDISLFEYKMSGFNTYGDEVSHRHFPSKSITSAKAFNKKINEDYLLHFAQTIHQIQQFSKVILIPPAIERITFINQAKDIDLLQKKMEQYELKFVVEPIVFTYSADCIFDTYYHLNKKGVDINTAKMIQILKDRI